MNIIEGAVPPYYLGQITKGVGWAEMPVSPAEQADDDWTPVLVVFPPRGAFAATKRLLEDALLSEPDRG